MGKQAGGVGIVSDTEQDEIKPGNGGVGIDDAAQLGLINSGDFIVQPLLGASAGPLGSIALAANAAERADAAAGG